MYRKMGRRQVQVLGLGRALKERLINTCADNLMGLRDQALIAAGYDTLCRRSELVQLQTEDLKIKSDSSGTIFVRRSKAHKFGDRRLAYLSPETIMRLSAWLDAAELRTGPIFRGVAGACAMSRGLHPSSVGRVLKERAREAGLARDVVAKLSGHSMRVGAAQDMAAAGIDLGAIMHAGGWKSADMVMRYIEHMDVEKSGMARLHRIHATNTVVLDSY